MFTHRLIATSLIATLIVTAIGCDEDERLAEMAERHSARQAEQNRQMADLQKEVAEGTRQLVEADARTAHSLWCFRPS